MAMFQRYLEPVIEEFTTGEYYPEVFKAKEDYFEKAGIIFEDDPEFEQRMSIFMDWYLFERDLPGVDLPPIKHYFRKNKDKMADREVAIYRDFCSTVHSLFRMSRMTWNKRGLVITDLFTRKTYKVMDPEINKGFARGDLFEARLIPFEGTYEFSRGFCFHPIETEGFILDEIKKVRFQDQKRQTKLILQLSQMKLKHLRYNHIDIRHIYSFQSRL